MNVRVWKGERELLVFECEWLHGLDLLRDDIEYQYNEGDGALFFQGVRCKQDFLLKCGDHFLVEFLSDGMQDCIESTFIYPKRDIYLNPKCHFLCDTFEFDDYIQTGVVYFAEAKLKGVLPGWRNLTEDHQKYSWLMACAKTNPGGFYFKPLDGLNLVDIDGSEISSEMDFYCLFAEKFFGEFGYCGANPGAFDDCVCELLKHLGDNFSLVIRNVESLKASLSRSDKENYHLFDLLVQQILLWRFRFCRILIK